MCCGNVPPDSIIAAKSQTSQSTLKCNQNIVGHKQTNILERKELISKDWTCLEQFDANNRAQNTDIVS